MTDYFSAVAAKPALKSNDQFAGDGSRPDLLLEQYKLTRQRLLTADKIKDIDEMYMKWCDLLFSGFNVVVLGAQSKYSLLETFRRRYLNSGRIPDFKAAIGLENGRQEPTNKRVKPASTTSKVTGDRPKTSVKSAAATAAPPPTRRLARRCKEPTPISSPAPTPVTTPATESDNESTLLENSPTNCPMLDIVTVRLHGFDPIKLEAFNHAIFDIKESRRAKDCDYYEFIRQIKKDKIHYVFMIHSFEYLLRDCEDVCETIFKLYNMDPVRIHLLMSSDVFNAGKKLNNLKIKLKFRFFIAPFSESFLREKTEIMNEFDAGVATANDTTVHRLFSEKTDLQSLKDIYQALDEATQAILTYIFKDFIDKTEAIESAGEVMDLRQFRPALTGKNGDNSGSDDDQEETSNKRRTTRAVAGGGGGGGSKRAASARGTKKQKSMGNYLDFHHLLNYCESKFIIRRGAALRDHLGELKDHSIITDEGTGNKIQCLIEPKLCRKFLKWVEQTNKA